MYVFLSANEKKKQLVAAQGKSADFNDIFFFFPCQQGLTFKCEALLFMAKQEKKIIVNTY